MVKVKGFFNVPVGQKSQSLTLLLLFERVSLVEYACQIWSLYLFWFKSYINFFAREREM